MCMCGKPTMNGEPGYSWDGKSVGVRPVDPPALGERDVLLYDEPGRCGGLDSHCHHYRVVQNVGLALLVKNGSGEERMRLSNGKAVAAALAALDSNGRYWILNAIYHAAGDAEQAGIDKAYSFWRKAAAEKRIKTRKRGGSVRVEIVS